MKAFNDYKDIKGYSENGGNRLPAGGYVVKVENVRYEDGQNGNSDRLVLAFDIAEGDQKGFFKNQFENNTSEDKKWKGVTNIYLPKDDGSEQDGWTKRRFKSIIEAFEASNKGYSWDWDETKLKGKIVGGLFVDTFTVIEGREICYTSLDAKNIRSVEFIKNGNYELKPILKNGATGTVSVSNKPQTDADGFMNIPDNAPEEIPF